MPLLALLCVLIWRLITGLGVTGAYAAHPGLFIYLEEAPTDRLSLRRHFVKPRCVIAPCALTMLHELVQAPPPPARPLSQPYCSQTAGVLDTEAEAPVS